MVIITEEQDDPKPKPTPSSSPNPNPNPNPKPKPTSSSPSNPFTFWFYFTILTSLLTSIFISLSSLSPSQNPKSHFLSLPSPLRHHFSHGRLIKVQPRPHHPPLHLFTTQTRHVSSPPSETVVIVHGLGLSSFHFRDVIEGLNKRGIHVVAFDLPGNGFSDKTRVEVVENGSGLFARLRFVVSEIKEKGVFWAFDEIVATGKVPFEEIEARARTRKVEKAIELDGGEIGKVLGEVIETMGIRAPVHLVLHDSALAMVSSWVLENVASVRSVTLMDTGKGASLPLWALEVPVVREVVLGVSYVHAVMVRTRCARGVSAAEMDAHRVLLRGRGGAEAVVGMGKKLNRSFDVGEWGGSEGLKGVPMQVLWSRDWSKEWREEGQRVANALPKARFVTHSGGRWPQEDVADELASHIANFVSSLPATIRKTNEESIPEHVQKLLDEAAQSAHHGHAHDVHGHAPHDDHSHHVHGAGGGYPDPYGLGHGH